jgi:hypothetical protein
MIDSENPTAEKKKNEDKMTRKHALVSRAEKKI